MPRMPREEVAGGVFHVFARGNNRQRIFLDDCDRETYLRLLGRVVRRQGWRCLAYCLMGNHVHLLLETPRPNLGNGMCFHHGHYARIFNDRHRRVGHLFQGRFGSVQMARDEQLYWAPAYIAFNPVAAGFCERPEDWPWSSYGAAVAGTPPAWLDTARLVSFLEPAGPHTPKRYAKLIGAAFDISAAA